MALKTWSDSTKAVLDLAHVGTQTTTHVGGTVVKIFGTYDEMKIIEVNQDAKEVEMVQVGQPK